MSDTPRVLLVVLDGFGERPETEGNAVRLARMPRFDAIYASNPWTLIDAAGYDVGLPDGQMGNSEVGHLNIGAGRIVYQDIVAHQQGDRGRRASTTTRAGRDRRGAPRPRAATLHLMGLASPGGVHASLEHAYAVSSWRKRRGLDAGRRGTPSSTGATRRRKSAAGYLRDDRAQARARSASARSPRSSAATTRWTATSAGTASRAPDDAHARRGQAVDDAGCRRGRLRGHAAEASPTSSSRRSRRWARRRAAGHDRGRRRGASSSTSAPTARASSRGRSHADAELRRASTRAARPKLGAFVRMTQYDATFGLPVAFPPQSAGR